MKRATKIILSLLTFVYIFPSNFSYCGDDVQKFHIKKFQCNVSEKYFHQNYSIKYKSVNRTCQILSVVGTNKKDINKALVRDIKIIIKS